MIKNEHNCLKIAIVHHHLNPGGVTKVIQSQIKSLKPFDVAIDLIVGALPVSDDPIFNDVNIIVEPKLNYLYAHEANEMHCLALYDFYLDFFERTIEEDTVVHIHNINLGKNPVLTYAVNTLMQNGQKVIHHCHDFAEDRPDNFMYMDGIISGIFKQDLAEIMYPENENYCIATINRLDQSRLPLTIEKEQSFYLPNPIEPPAISIKKSSEAKRKVCDDLKISDDKTLVTYPVRVIERKNIGELILLAKLFSDTAHFAVTQPPKNPEQIIAYDSWKQFCVLNNIPVIFEAGMKTNFSSLLNGSDFCISTSKQEGFGMAFLEPWLFGTPVIGRNIKMVTQDFVDEGIILNKLYDELLIDGKDFIKYSIEEQKNIIKTATQESIFKENPTLETLLLVFNENDINHNIGIINSEYSLEKYGIKLYGIYSKMLENTRTVKAD